MVAGRFFDGHVAQPREVSCSMEGSREHGTLVLADRQTGRALARMPVSDLLEVEGRKDELRVRSVAGVPGARLVFEGSDAAAAHELLPVLAHRTRADRRRQRGIVATATAGLAGVVALYLFGVPLLATQITSAFPPEWEIRLGATVAAQVEASLAEMGGFSICDPDPDSLANRAITRFAAKTVEGTGTPFTPKVTVARTSIANAFALPGGQIYYFSALLEQTETADEFASVLAHEVGHVVYRHGMEGLVASAGTGLLIGFMLGDLTGISLAGGLGAAIIDSRHSREAERQADQFSAEVAARTGFDPASLPDLLDRVAGDDDSSAALALLSSHPLTQERRLALAGLNLSQTAAEPAFSPEEWEAIRGMCERQAVTGGARAVPRVEPKISVPKR